MEYSEMNDRFIRYINTIEKKDFITKDYMEYLINLFYLSYYKNDKKVVTLLKNTYINPEQDNVYIGDLFI